MNYSVCYCSSKGLRTEGSWVLLYEWKKKIFLTSLERMALPGFSHTWKISPSCPWVQPYLKDFSSMSLVSAIPERFPLHVLGFSHTWKISPSCPWFQPYLKDFPFMSLVSALFFSSSAIPLEDAEKNDNIAIVMTSHGGHIGFVEGAIPRHRSYMYRWVRQFVPAVFEHGIKNKWVKNVENFCFISTEFIIFFSFRGGGGGGGILWFILVRLNKQWVYWHGNSVYFLCVLNADWMLALLTHISIKSTIPVQDELKAVVDPQTKYLWLRLLWVSVDRFFPFFFCCCHFLL